MKIEYSKQAKTAAFILVDENILIFHIETSFIKTIFICNVINCFLKTTDERKKSKLS